MWSILQVLGLLIGVTSVVLVIAFLVARAVCRKKDAAYEELRASSAAQAARLHASVEAVAYEAEVAGAEVSQAADERNQLTFIASHDLKEPIRAMMMSAQVIADVNSDFDTRTKFIQHLLNSAHKSMAVVDSFVKFAKLGAKIDPEPTDIGLVVADALRTLSGRVAETGTTIRNDMATHDTLVLGEHALLVQVLENVIGNAIKFSANEDSPIVRISHFFEDAHVVVSVADNGIGIEDQYLSRIGEACYRLNPESEYSGSGLGLTLVNKILTAHGGSIEMKSEGRDKGTTVQITLPQFLWKVEE